MKKVVSLLLSLLLVVSMVVGCSSEEPEKEMDSAKTGNEVTETKEEAKEDEKAEPTEAKEKPVVKVYGKVIEYTSGPMMTDALTEMVKDKYVIDAIQVDWGNQDKVIRTGIAAGDPCDIYNYTPSGMVNFQDMALDLKPYLDADPEWRSQFSDAAIAKATYDGKIVNVPWEQNFPVVLANKTKLDELGIVIPETWTIDEFAVVAQQIRDAGMYPLANANDLGRASWMYRNAMLSVVVSEGVHDQFVAGELPLSGPESQKALEQVKKLYDNDFMYPGAGAITVKNDEIKAGFYQGDVLMMTEIAAGAKNTAKQADFEVVTVPWPSAGEVQAINGVYNGFFIPANVKDADVAIDVLKAFTSESIQSIHGEQGYIPAHTSVKIEDPFVKSVVTRASAITQGYPYSIEQMDYFRTMILADLILNGGVDVAMDKLAELDK